jgi:ribosomal-protein-alanine N-acetyltransferase
VTLIVREGTRDDVPAIMSVMATAFHPDYGEAWNETQCIGALALPGCWMHVAFSQGECVGFAITRSVFEEAELMLIAVRPYHQHAGLGQSLFSAIEDKCNALGVIKIHVEMRSDNPALTFYSLLGFQIVGERPNYYQRRDGKSASALTLCRILPKDSAISG